jgi:hypothetical protein
MPLDTVCVYSSVNVIDAWFSKEKMAELVTYALKYCNNVKRLYHSLCSVPITETSFNLRPWCCNYVWQLLSFNLHTSQNTPLAVQAPRYHNKAKQGIDSAVSIHCFMVFFSISEVIIKGSNVRTSCKSFFFMYPMMKTLKQKPWTLT